MSTAATHLRGVSGKTEKPPLRFVKNGPGHPA